MGEDEAKLVSATDLGAYERAVRELLDSEAAAEFHQKTGLAVEGLVLSGPTQDAGHEGETLRLDVTPARHHEGFDLVVTYD